MCGVTVVTSVMYKNAFSMVELERLILKAILFVLLIIRLPLIDGAYECPTGFHPVFNTTSSPQKYCFSLKSQEIFSDKYVNCETNLFEMGQFSSLKLRKEPFIWTDYKSLYPGGVLFDWSYTHSTGSIWNDTYKWRLSSVVNDDLCVAFFTDLEFEIVGCKRKRFRYCVVEAGPSSPKLKRAELNVNVDPNRKDIQLNINYDDVADSKLEDNIRCFTDSTKYYLEPVEFDKFSRLIEAKDNGYYWCTRLNNANFYITDSNRALYFSDLSEKDYWYAVKIKTDTYKDIRLGDDVEADRLLKVWTDKLSEYLYYSSEYRKSNTGPYNITDVIDYRKMKPGYYSGVIVIINKKLKRLYVDGQSALLHVELYPDQPPLKPGQWDNIHVQYMRPVYYCDMEKEISLGKNYSDPADKCNVYKCEGDYNEGVEMIPVNICDNRTSSVTTEGLSHPTTEGLPHPTAEGLTHPSTKTDVVGKIIDEVSVLANSTDPINDLYNIYSESGELLEQVYQEMNGYLNSSSPIEMENFKDTFNKVDKILVQKGLIIKSDFLHLLDDIAARLDLNGSKDSFVHYVQNNIAIAVAIAKPGAPVRGIQIAVSGSNTLTNETISILRDFNRSNLLSNDNEVVVDLPETVWTSNRRVSFIMFRDDHAFHGAQEHYIVNSKILSVKVENLTQFPPGEEINIYLKPSSGKTKRNQNRTCAFWKFHDNNTGSWSEKNCKFFPASQANQLDRCSCDHLTHFAEILIRTGFSEAIEEALEIISIIGCCASILSLLLVGLTAATFHPWRREYSNKIWLQLSISIILLSVCFLVIVFAQFQNNDISCQVTGVALHYLVLSSFFWMFVASIVSYRKLVAVFSQDPSRKLLRAAIFAWGAPCVLPGILLAVNPQSYARQYEDKSPSGAFCYPTGLALWVTVRAPIILILLSNCTLFVLILRSVFGSPQPHHQGREGRKETLRCASLSCLLAFLFGLPWLLGLVAFDVVLVFLFTILVTFQGVLLFMLFVCNKNTRDLWLFKLKIRNLLSNPVTYSTDFNPSRNNVPLSNL